MKHKPFTAITAILLILSLAACGSAPPAGPYGLSQAVYPDMAPYPNEADYTDSATGEIKEAFYEVCDAWQEARRTQAEQSAVYENKLDSFLRRSIPQFLSGSQDTPGTNRVYSPLNVYLALGMLAELTEGNSRQQILELLDVGSIQELRSLSNALWNANYCNDGAVTSILASSLWLNQDVSFIPSTMEQLAQTYYASSFQGEMGSEAFDQALQNWLNQQTGGLLEDQASGMTLDPNTILALAATVYFRAKWVGEFSESNTSPDIFHAPGQDISCDFMHQTDSRDYYWSDKFSAVSKGLEGSGAMWLILPDEGITVDQLLQDEKTMDFLLEKEDWAGQKHLTVNLSLPKFDTASKQDLISGLQVLGITDVFDPTVSDFSPMTKDLDGIFVSKAEHAARVTIDEEGCTAASYTVMAACGAGMPPEEEVDFVVNRPFLFAITGTDGLPLFVGVVTQPVES